MGLYNSFSKGETVMILLNSSHHPQEVLLAQFSLYVHKGGLKPLLNSESLFEMRLLIPVVFNLYRIDIVHPHLYIIAAEHKSHADWMAMP